jgi:hypothetical protein
LHTHYFYLREKKEVKESEREIKMEEMHIETQRTERFSSQRGREGRELKKKKPGKMVFLSSLFSCRVSCVV